MEIIEINKKVKPFYSKLDFELEKIEDNTIFLVTRENGDVLNEQYSDEDWNNALKIERYVEGLYDEVFCSIQTCDEWVHLEISLL